MVTDISNSESMIADFIVNAKVSPEVRQTTRRYLLDWMGSALAGSSKIPAQSINNVINQLGGKPHSTILSDGTKPHLLLRHSLMPLHRISLRWMTLIWVQFSTLQHL